MKFIQYLYIGIATFIQIATGFSSSNGLSMNKSIISSSSSLHMSLPNEETNTVDKFRRKSTEKKKSSSFLSAVSILDSYDNNVSPPMEEFGITTSELQSRKLQIPPVLSTSLLITGSTVGASCLVLPTTAEGPGIIAATGLFLASFVINFISGLIIAEVAIKQYEVSGHDVPSSFKAFASANLDSNAAANTVSALSIFNNCCVLAFDLTRGGSIGSDLTGLDSSIISVGFASVMSLVVATQSSKRLSTVASMAVCILVSSFACLLLPGLANISDPLQTVLSSKGTSDDIVASALTASPIIIQAMVYQNIVPTVTKILNYDRQQVATAIFIGSFLPAMMFIAWCFVFLGGGINSNELGQLSGPLLTVFSLAAVCGSSLGCSMSISEEYDQIISQLSEQSSSSRKISNNNDNIHNDDTFSSTSVLMAFSVPLAAGLWFSSGNEEMGSFFLSCAGAYGTPLLYGLIPVVMAWKQREKYPSIRNMLPTTSLGLIGLGSLVFVFEEYMKEFGPFHAVPV